MKYLLIVIFGIFLSCSDTTSGRDLATKSEVQGNTVTITKPSGRQIKFEIIKIRDCQYIIYKPEDVRESMCHLGDCDNPIHKK